MNIDTKRIIREQASVGLMNRAAQTRSNNVTSAAGRAAYAQQRKPRKVAGPDDKTSKYGLNTPSFKAIPAQRTGWSSRIM